MKKLLVLVIMLVLGTISFASASDSVNETEIRKPDCARTFDSAVQELGRDQEDDSDIDSSSNSATLQ